MRQVFAKQDEVEKKKLISKIVDLLTEVVHNIYVSLENGRAETGMGKEI